MQLVYLVYIIKGDWAEAICEHQEVYESEETAQARVAELKKKYSRKKKFYIDYDELQFIQEKKKSGRRKEVCS